MRKILLASLAFLVTVVFLSPVVVGEYLSLRRGSFAGASVPAPTGDIVYTIDRMDEWGVQYIEVLEISGWAFIEGKDATNSSIRVVLRSESGVYFFDAVRSKRSDVTDFYKTLDLDDSGFIAAIPLPVLDEGKYRVGILIRKEGTEAFQYTDRSVYKYRGGVVTENISSPVKTRLPGETADIMFGVDLADTVHEKAFKYFKISGWAFQEGKDPESNETYIVLKTDDKDYVFSVARQKRPDVASYFKEPGLDSVGFSAVIPGSAIEKGTYRIGILVRGDGSAGLRYTGKIIDNN